MNFCAVPAKPAEVGCRLGCVGRVLPYAVVTPALPLRCALLAPLKPESLSGKTAKGEQSR
jgi:hypothetical protein